MLIYSTIDDLLKNGNNGDLVLMSGNTRGEKSCRFFTRTMFSHVGILFRENHPSTNNDLLYIFDADVGQRMKEGPRVMLLEDKLKLYHGYKWLLWRKLKTNAPATQKNNIQNTQKDNIQNTQKDNIQNTQKDNIQNTQKDNIHNTQKDNNTKNIPTTENFLECIKDFGDLEFDKNMLSYYTSSGPLSIFNSLTKNKNKVFCSELIAMILQHNSIKILNKTHKPYWYTPRHFEEKNIKDMNDGYFYDSGTFVDFSSITA